jgi:hypothetical protein
MLLEPFSNQVNLLALPCRTPEVRGLLLLIANSYYKLTGKILIEADFERLPDAIFNAPFVLLAHDKFQVGASVLKLSGTQLPVA